MDQTNEQTDNGDQSAPDASRSRRDLLLKGTVAAAVAAVAGTAGSRSVIAADGDNLTIGQNNTGSATTLLQGGSTFKVENGGTAGQASIYGMATGSTSLYGIRGDRSGSTVAGGAGVYGSASDDGQIGVLGGASGNVGYGVYGEHTGSTFTTGYGVYGSAIYGNAVYGVISGTSQTAISGEATAGGVGVRGASTGSTVSGTGVVGSATLGVGVLGLGTTFDLRAGGSGRIGLKGATPNPSVSASGEIGTIARDNTGALWYCYAPNQWQRLGGPTTAGAFVPLTPFRVYDSREPVPSPGRITAGQNRVISVKDARSLEDGTVIVSDAVPVGATAVAFNVTVVNTLIRGFLYVADGDATAVGASTINWSSDNLVIANSAIVKISESRQIKVFCGGLGAADFIIDIAGYYL